MSTPSSTHDDGLASIFRAGGGRVTGLKRASPTSFNGKSEGTGANRRWAIAGLVLGCLAAVLVFAPAQWLVSALGQVTKERLQLLDARGTLWNGSAVAMLTAGAGSQDARALPGRLNWQLRPQWTGARLTLQQPCCLPQGVDLQINPGWARLRIAVQPRAADAPAIPGMPAGPVSNTGAKPGPGADQAWGQWPANWLGGLGTPWNTMELGGALRLSSQGLVMQWVQGRFSLEGRADLDIQDLRSRLSTVPRLGSYRLALSANSAQPGTAQLSLTTVDGALQLSAQGSWSASGLRLRGEASAKEADQAALANLLNIIGRRDGNRSILSIG